MNKNDNLHDRRSIKSIIFNKSKSYAYSCFPSIQSDQPTFKHQFKICFVRFNSNIAKRMSLSLALAHAHSLALCKPRSCLD